MPTRRPRRLRQARRPELTIKQILAWADHEFEQKGRWPRTTDLHLLADRNEKWRNIDNSLRSGGRGLPRGGSLARLLAKRRGVRNRSDLPPLSEQQIVRWAKEHYRHRGTWPHADSGPVIDVPGEKWDNIDVFLQDGLRGLPGGDSIARLLARECGPLTGLSCQGSPRIRLSPGPRLISSGPDPGRTAIVGLSSVHRARCGTTSIGLCVMVNAVCPAAIV
jgi:hypothetical protein